jgi:hypothetical protein
MQGFTRESPFDANLKPNVFQIAKSGLLD